jgi:hypothetical protein
MQINQFWWDTEDEGALASDLFGYVNRLIQQQSYRQEENFKHMRLYGNMEAYALRGYGFYNAEPSSIVAGRVTLNVVQSMVDTVTSKLTKNKPKPTFLTEGGNWEMQSRAKKLTQFVEGQFQATDFYPARAIAIQNSAIFGTGPVKIFREGKQIKLEQTFIDELIVPDSEAIYGAPRQLHQRKKIHKDVLKNMFPDHAEAIETTCSLDLSTFQSNSIDLASGMVTVLESWKLPSGDEAADGRHVICMDKLTLLDEPWIRNYFPFVFWRWGVRPLGFFGQGLAEQLTGLQLEINKLLRTIQISMHLVSVPKIFVEASSNIVSAHLNNKIGGIVKYTGTRPEQGPLGTIPAELFTHLDRLYNRAFEIAGISQLSAQSQKPSGLDSGKALREFNDIESERFLSVGTRDEEAVMLASKMYIDAAKEIKEEFGEYNVKVSSGSSISTLEWDDVCMAEDKYIMRVFPTSALASTPAGKLADVQELLQAGFINKEDGMKLLDFPDLRQFYNFNNAGVEDIERCIEFMIDKGEYSTPEPYQNLQLGITKMQQAYLLFKTQNAPENRLELFRRWIEDANGLLMKAAQAGQPAVGGPVPAMDPSMAAEEPVDALALQQSGSMDPAADAALLAQAQAPIDPMAVPAAPPTSELLPV